jgi:type VI secretion system protein
MPGILTAFVMELMAMVAVSLLERLKRDAGDGSSLPAAGSESAIMDSILRNLGVLLNSRQGCCETRPDYGLSDFNGGQDIRGAFPAIAREVERQIRLFEPRLRNVRVRPVEDKARLGELIFHISGEIAYPDRTVRISLDSILGNNGHMRLNG